MAEVVENGCCHGGAAAYRRCKQGASGVLMNAAAPVVEGERAAAQEAVNAG